MEKLEKLQHPLSFNLDEAAEEYAPDFSNSIASKAAVDAVRDAFKAGAQWQKERDQSTIELAEDHAYFAGSENTREKLIDKVCEWLLNNVGYYSTNALGKEYMCEDLRKAMEE